MISWPVLGLARLSEQGSGSHRQVRNVDAIEPLEHVGLECTACRRIVGMGVENDKA